LLTGSVVAITFPLLEGRSYHWAPWCWICLVAGLAGLGLLAVIDSRRRDQRPLLPTGLLRRRAVAAGIAVQLLFSAGLQGML